MVDEAYLRRIQTKVRVQDVSPQDFDRIFERVLEGENVTCDPGAAEYLRQRCLNSGPKALRACYPHDVFRLIKAVNKYDGKPARVTRDNIDRAADLYFAKVSRRPSIRQNDFQITKLHA